MKKFINKILLAILGLCCAIVVIPVASAHAMVLNNDEYDNIFLKTVDEYAKENCGGVY